MKHLKQFCITIILVFALTGVALADDGIIHPLPPAPSPTPTTTDGTTTDNTVTDPTTSTQADDPVLDAALDLAQLALSRF